MSACFNDYKFLFKINNQLIFFKQLKSFQDPILQIDNTDINRPFEFKIADIINYYLPSKNQTFYIIDYGEDKNRILSQTTYVYAKRGSASTISRDHLVKGTILNKKINILKNDLLNAPPDLIVLPESKKIINSKDLTPVIEWLYSYINEKYKLIERIDYINHLNNPEYIYLLKRV